VRGYDGSSYGDGMAEVYDDWYPTPTDTEDCVNTLANLAGGTRVLELGAGTGRLAIPLAQRGLEVHALDGSARMIERLRAKSGADTITTYVSDMGAPLPPGPFGLVFVAVNTFFGLIDEGAQAAAMQHVAAVLTRPGRFVVEAFVPEAQLSGDRVDVRDLTADRVVLSVSRTDATTQRASGQFIEFRDGEPVRLRPWAIRWATTEQLDACAAVSGFTLEHRWASWDRTPFGPESAGHVSVYRLD
jgi:SAM-dependent methyltransferase